MQLDIITPEMIVFSGRVSSVTVPGSKGRFTVLENHAPIISSLEPGLVIYHTNNEILQIESAGGFIEVNNNQISIVIEEPDEQAS